MRCVLHAVLYISSLIHPPALPPVSYNLQPCVKLVHSSPTALRSASSPVQHAMVYLLRTRELPELHMQPSWLPGLWPSSLPSHAAYLMKIAKQQKRRGINLLPEPKKMPYLHSVNNNKTTRRRKERRRIEPMVREKKKGRKKNKEEGRDE